MADFTKYPEGPQEIAKLLDFLPEDEQVRFNYIMAMMGLALS